MKRKLMAGGFLVLGAGLWIGGAFAEADVSASARSASGAAKHCSTASAAELVAEPGGQGVFDPPLARGPHAPDELP